MKTVPEWRAWLEEHGYALLEKGAIEAIQKDAFEAGRVDAINGALHAIREHGWKKAYDFLEMRRHQIIQSKDTPCLKNTP